MPTHAQKPAAENRRARRDYEIERTLEAGLVLSGSEVKSLRLQRADLTQSWAGGRGGELFLFNADIPAYTHAIGRNHEPKRQRKLLVHKKERTRLLIAVQQKGLTLVPLKLYFNARGRAKLLLGLGRGRRQWQEGVRKTRAGSGRNPACCGASRHRAKRRPKRRPKPGAPDQRRFFRGVAFVTAWRLFYERLSARGLEAGFRRIVLSAEPAIAAFEVHAHALIIGAVGHAIDALLADAADIALNRAADAGHFFLQHLLRFEIIYLEIAPARSALRLSGDGGGSQIELPKHRKRTTLINTHDDLIIIK